MSCFLITEMYANPLIFYSLIHVNTIGPHTGACIHNSDCLLSGHKSPFHDVKFKSCIVKNSFYSTMLFDSLNIGKSKVSIFMMGVCYLDAYYSDLSSVVTNWRKSELNKKTNLGTFNCLTIYRLNNIKRLFETTYFLS